MSSTANQPLEQLSRDTIYQKLAESDWFVQDKANMNFNAGLGTTVRECPTGIGLTGYVLFVDPSAVSVVEAKPETWGEKLTKAKEKPAGYANAQLKWVSNTHALTSVYESTGTINRILNEHLFATNALKAEMTSTPNATRKKEATA